MKIIMLIMAFIAPMSLNAEPQINILDNFCHWPTDVDNQDNEYFIAGCNGWVKVEDGEARGYARVAQNHDIQNIESVEILGVDSAEPCVLTDSNGVVYHAPYFNSTIIKRPDKVIFFLRCAHGVAQ